MNFLKMQKKITAVVAAAMITTTILPMGAITMAENQTEKKAVKIVQTAGRDQLGTFAPEFARYNDDILFDSVLAYRLRRYRQLAEISLGDG